METINFCGTIGIVKDKSPHGNYLVVELSDRVSIVGTFNNAFQWEESRDKDSGFISFITYIGYNNSDDLELIKELVCEDNGYFKKGEDKLRKAKRVRGCLYELKVRGFSPKNAIDVINRLQGREEMQGQQPTEKSSFFYHQWRT